MISSILPDCIKDINEPYLYPKNQTSISNDQFLNLKNEDISNYLANQCDELLQRIPLDLKGSYRVELVLDSNENVWKLGLSLNPDKWFDLLYDSATSAEEQDKVFENAHRYITNSFNSFKKLPEPDQSEPPKNEYGSTSLCAFQNNCKSHKENTVCLFMHMEWECKILVEYYNDTNKSKCDVKVYKEGLIDKSGDWFLYTRWHELTREVLIMPNDKLIAKGIAHGNEGLIKNQYFWRKIRSTCHSFQNYFGIQATDRIVINFGKWETGVRKNSYLKECHSHAHIWLTYDFVKAMLYKDNEKEKSNQVYMKMKKLLENHIHRPNDYLKINADSLYNKIMFYEMENSKKRIKNIDNKIEVMDNKMDQILKILTSSSPTNSNFLPTPNSIE